MHTLVIFDPRHFHAALTLRERHPRLSDQVFVYSEGGGDLDRFLEIVESYNTRPENPTAWQVQIYRGGDCLEKMIVRKKGDIAVLAGRNDTKMAVIAALARAGFNVLSDKPWVTDYDALDHLRSALAPGGPAVEDIMTERFEITTVLQKKLVASERVFGRPLVAADGSPTVYKRSVHHLYKLVNNRPLIRPAWYFDVKVQGEGIVDVSTHLVDMTGWILFPGQTFDYDRDIELLQARRWPTRVPLETFRLITGEDNFPAGARDQVRGGALDYFCNGEMVYRLKGVPVHLKLIWDLIEPEGAKDLHESVIKGTRSNLRIRQLAEKGFMTELLVEPQDDPDRIGRAVQDCLDDWQDLYPGLSLGREGNLLVINIPAGLRTTHEEHFCKVRDQFIDNLDRGSFPPENRPNLLARYTLIAQAREMALSSPFEML